MSDFIKSHHKGRDDRQLKNPNMCGNTNYRHDKKRHSGTEKRSGYDRRKNRTKRPQTEEMLARFLTELSPTIKAFLESVSESQLRQVKANELRTRAEEEKVNAITALTEYLKSDGMQTLLNQSEGRKKKTKARKPIDPIRKKVMEIISDRRNKGETFDQIALYLEKENVQTFSGKGQWHAQTIHRLYQDYFQE